MRPGALLYSFLLALPASVLLSGFAGSDLHQNPEQSAPQQSSQQSQPLGALPPEINSAPLTSSLQQSQPLGALPPNPQEWVCQDSTTPATQEEIDAWCEEHPNRGVPVPADLRNPPPVADFLEYQKYSNRLKTFLTTEEYGKLGWITDAHWRLSGPSVIPPDDFGNNYGPHFPLRVYYSPEIVDWLCSGRKGEIPDGAMMVKAMAFFSIPLAPGSTPVKILNTKVAEDGCMDLDPTTTLGSPILPSPLGTNAQVEPIIS